MTTGVRWTGDRMRKPGAKQTRRPADIDQFQAKITHLEQQAVDLRLQLEERTQDVAAARAANRDLMTRLNTPGTTR